MNGDSKYKLIRDRLSAEYNYQYNTLRTLLRDDNTEFDVDTIDDLLTTVMTLKMKIEILDVATNGETRPSQKLLFD